MITRTATLAFVTLSLLLTTYGQGGGNGTPLQLVAVPGPGTLGAAQTTTLTISGVAGAWVYPHGHCYLEAPNDDPALQAFVAQELATYPYLAPIDAPAAVLGNVVGGSPNVTQNVEAVLGLAARAARTRDDVAYYFQPLVGSAGTTSTLVWDATPALWQQIMPPTPQTMMNKWRKRLEYDAFINDGLTTVFSIEKLARFALHTQAPSPQVATAAWSARAAVWAGAGVLKVDMQAIALIDPAALLFPGLIDLEAPGLDSLPAFPSIQTSGTVTLDVILRAPISPAQVVAGNLPDVPDIPGLPLLPTAVAGGYLVVPLDGVFPPLTMNVTCDTASYTLTGQATGAVGYARFALPASLAAGCILTIDAVTNSLASTDMPWPDVLIAAAP